MKVLASISKFLDALCSGFGKAVAWICLLLVIVICSDVLMRYAFDETKVWVIGLEWQLFSLLFLVGAAYALQKDKHVRVDVFYHRFRPRVKALVNLFGHLFFLIPFCLIVINASLNYALNSFNMNEGSPDPGGLPARYLVKFAIVLGFGLLLLQAISQILKSLLFLLRYKREQVT